MIKDALTHITGGEYFATIPLVVFVLIFIAVIIWAFKLDRVSVNEWSRIPLDGNPSEKNERENDR
jgi:cbb3-type cytochrome oxidase subunit 3